LEIVETFCSCWIDSAEFALFPAPSLSALHGPEAKQQYRLKISRSVWVLEARRTPGPRGPAGDIQAAVDNAEKAAKAIVIERLDSYVQRTEAIAARVRQQVDSANGSIRSEFQNIVNSAAVKALRGALENEVAALVLKILVEYQVADIAGTQSKSTEHQARSSSVAP
jgi:hypothetical protein